MSAEITSTVWGIVPWSDELLKVSGDVDRGRAELHDLTEQEAADFGAAHQVLEAAGITYRTDFWGGGKMDYFRGIVAGSHGFRDDIRQAPVTRWFDTNTFYRQPTIEGPLEHWSAAGHGYHLLFTEASNQLATYQPTFLSPYAFAKLAARVDAVDEGEAHRLVGDLYDGLLDDAAGQGVGHVLFHEPYAAYHQIDKRERATLEHAVGSLAANHPELEVGVFFSYGNAAELVGDYMADDRLAAVGCDLQRTPIDELRELPEHRFLAGVVDGANTLIRDDEEILDELKKLEAVVGTPEISVTHTVDLEHVPHAYAAQKIAQIGRIARALEGGQDE